MFDWFFEPKTPAAPAVKHEDTWITQEHMTDMSVDKVVVTASTDGAVKVDFGAFSATIQAGGRHHFLEKIQRAVAMADIADPKNEPLNKVLE